MINILLSGAGGGACIGVIKSLRLSNKSYRIIVTDSNELSAGFYLADKYYVVPKASKLVEFISMIRKIIEKEHVDFILPTSGFDVEPLSLYKNLFEDTNIMLMNDYNTVMLCHDKLKTKKALGNVSYVPWGEGYERFRFEKEKGGETFFEKYLPGDEYTIDTLSNMNGEFIMAVPRLRIETMGSYSYKGEIVLDEEIINICKDICERLLLKGVNCIQMKRDGEDKPKLIEINPRFGGSTHFTTLAGANFAEMLVDIGLGKKIKKPKIKPIKIVRYFNEVII